MIIKVPDFVSLKRLISSFYNKSVSWPVFTSTAVISDLIVHTETSCCWWFLHRLTTKNQVPRHIRTLLLEQLLEAGPQPVHHEWEHKQKRRGQRVSQWWLKVERNVLRSALPGCFLFLYENCTFLDSKRWWLLPAPKGGIKILMLNETINITT